MRILSISRYEYRKIFPRLAENADHKSFWHCLSQRGSPSWGRGINLGHEFVHFTSKLQPISAAFKIIANDRHYQKCQKNHTKISKCGQTCSLVRSEVGMQMIFFSSPAFSFCPTRSTANAAVDPVPRPTTMPERTWSSTAL